MKVYHYTDYWRWEKIKDTKGCLEPRVHVEPLPAGIFCFPESPLPESWTRNQKVPGAMDFLLSYLSSKTLMGRLVVLEFDVTEKDDVWVGESMHWYAQGSKENERSYLASITQLAKYKGPYELPEIIVKNPIPFDRILCAETFTNPYEYLEKHDSLPIPWREKTRTHPLTGLTDSVSV
jgi:hypothetical protein